MADQFFFSSGKLYVAPYSQNGYLEADVVGALQNAEFDSKCEMKTVREAAHLAMYPVDDAEYDWTATLKVEALDMAENLIPYTTGAVKSTSGGFNVYTHGGIAKPQYVKVKIEGKLSDGRDAILELVRAKAPGMSLSFKREDYADKPVEFTTLPLNGVGDAWIFKVAIAS